MQGPSAKLRRQGAAALLEACVPVCSVGCPIADESLHAASCGITAMRQIPTTRITAAVASHARVPWTGRGAGRAPERPWRCSAERSAARRQAALRPQHCASSSCLWPP